MDGTRTHDRSDHNRELYQLSYHRRREAGFCTTCPRPVKHSDKIIFTCRGRVPGKAAIQAMARPETGGQE